MPSMHHLNPSASVWPGSTGSSPCCFINSLKSLIVPHRPVFNRRLGMPSAAQISMHFLVCSTLLATTAGSGLTNP